MKKKLVILISVLILLILTSILVSASTTPIVDGTDILNQPTDAWDELGHSLAGLQIERGDGFVNFVIPRSPDNPIVWGIHTFVTLTDAEFSDVVFSQDTFYVLEIDGDDGAFEPTKFAYNDEVDWNNDSAKPPSSLVNQPNELEMWLLTNSKRDGFRANVVNYGFCPRMKVEFIFDDPAPFEYGGAQFNFEIDGTPYPYPSEIPLSNCQIVDIDIKPGSDPSCFNNNGKGVIPVAILGSADFDVFTVDPESVTLEGLEVASKGKSGKLLAAYEDANSDGYLDLVLKFVDQDGTFTKGSGTATLTGSLSDGTPILGTGDICVTQ